MRNAALRIGIDDVMHASSRSALLHSESLASGDTVDVASMRTMLHVVPSETHDRQLRQLLLQGEQNDIRADPRRIGLDVAFALQCTCCSPGHS